MIAKDAKEVVIDRFGTIFPLAPVEDGAWEGTFDMGTGFLYFFLKVDGADVLCPYLPIGYGCCRPMNFVDVPVDDMAGWVQTLSMIVQLAACAAIGVLAWFLYQNTQTNYF